MVENNIATAFTFVTSFGLTLGIGVVAYKRTTKLSDYILDGRSLGHVT